MIIFWNNTVNIIKAQFIYLLILKLFIVHDPTSFQLLYISCINKGDLPTYVTLNLHIIRGGVTPRNELIFLAVFGLKVVSLQAGSLCDKKEGEEEPAY